jgi:hypothetical protein
MQMECDLTVLDDTVNVRPSETAHADDVERLSKGRHVV